MRAHTQWFNMEQKGIETPKLWMKKCSTDDDATKKQNKTKQNKTSTNGITQERAS